MPENAMLGRSCGRAWRIDGHYILASDVARSASLMIFASLAPSIERDSRNGTIIARYGIFKG